MTGILDLNRWVRDKRAAMDQAEEVATSLLEPYRAVAKSRLLDALVELFAAHPRLLAVAFYTTWDQEYGPRVDVQQVMIAGRKLGKPNTDGGAEEFEDIYKLTGPLKAIGKAVDDMFRPIDHDEIMNRAFGSELRVEIDRDLKVKTRSSL